MPYIPQLVCGNCNQAMVADKNDVMLEMHISDDTFNKDPASLLPYYKVAADRYKCKTCGFTVYTGLSRTAIEHYDERYNRLRTDIHVVFSDFKYDQDNLKVIEARLANLALELHHKLINSA